MFKSFQQLDLKTIDRKAKRENVHRITIEPFGACLYLFKGVASYNDRFERIFGLPSAHDAYEEMEVGGFFAVEQGPLGYGIPVLVISDLAPEYPEEFIWHEALHATFTILDTYGVKHDVENHEIFNYTQASIVSEVRQRLYGLEGFER